MERNPFVDFDPRRVPSPCHVIEINELKKNLEILADIQNQSGAKILLALKAFAMFHFAPLISKYLSGICASGIHEAKLGREEFGGEVHTYGPGFPPDSVEEILRISDHVMFNSFHQIRKFKDSIHQAKKQNPRLQIGVRINPECSVSPVDIYDPSGSCSRMGVLFSDFQKENIDLLDGLHFHNLCEQNLEPLVQTLEAFEKNFGPYLSGMKWVNFGGGHHITRKDYDRKGLIDLLKKFKEKYDVQIYLEPGEAIAWSIGGLVSEVLDIVENQKQVAIMDTSATAHMPDVLEMPYTPEITHAGTPEEYEYPYRIASCTCLSGDIIGDYSFRKPLKIGDRLILSDMAYYTMVKTSEFNGILRPSIAVWDKKTDEVQVIKRFGYEDYKKNLS